MKVKASPPSRAFKLFIRKLCLSPLKGFYRNRKPRSLGNRHHGIWILCRLQLLLKPCISLDCFLECFELLFLHRLDWRGVVASTMAHPQPGVSRME